MRSNAQLKPLLLLVSALFIITAVFASTDENAIYIPGIQVDPVGGPLMVSQVSDNRSSYSGDRVPQYEKFEITFQVRNSVAGNFQLPYDPSPPNGIDASYSAHHGISVDALFTPDNWETVYQQPAFYYQYFQDDVKRSWDGREHQWVNPTEKFAWKVRFSPDRSGTWEYKLVAQDASGRTESEHRSFEVVNSNNHGFIRVSKSDSRYFEFDDGELFYPMGIQVGSRLEDSAIVNEPLFQAYELNGINLKRIWIGSIYGSAWLNWQGGREVYDGYLPRSGILPFYDPIRDRYTLAQRIDYEAEGDTRWHDACRFHFWNDPEAIKTNTNYRLRIKYWGEDITGPRDNSFGDFGLVGKIGGGWEIDCYEPGTSTAITDYGHNTSDWEYLEGNWYSGNNNFLPRIYLGLENVDHGRVYVNSISLQEDLGGGQFGPEIIAESSMEYDLYYPEQEVYGLDKVIELAEANGVYLKLVVHEKNDQIYLKLDDDGTFVYDEPDNQDGFYGVGRQTNKTRWLQRAWWRYLQARWGYSTAIHSWELINEGDPGNPNHFALTDEFGKFMHCQAFGITVASGDGEACNYDHPNDHLVTTSFWHSFPGAPFWANPDYPNVDYVDLHAYVSTGFLPDNPQYQIDSALFHLDYSSAVRNNLNHFSEENGIPTKPIIRGETGIDFLNEQRENPDLAEDQNGVWLHNLIWPSLDRGAMSELYWWWINMEQRPGPDGEPGLYEIFRYFSDFMDGIPLANGYYQAAEATLTDSNLRVTGQKDLFDDRAHLWVQNKNHTWRNVVDGAAGISGLSGTVTIEGFTANKAYTVEWHEFTTQGLPTIRHSDVISTDTGAIILNLPTDSSFTDVGIKIGQ